VQEVIEIGLGRAVQGQPEHAHPQPRPSQNGG
jgi:hypothetical protein